MKHFCLEYQIVEQWEKEYTKELTDI